MPSFLLSGKVFLWIQGTTTKKYNFFCLKFIFSFFTFFRICFSVFAADSTWILAAEKFSLTQKRTNATLESVRSAMPSLILEQFAENLERMPRAREQLDRSLYDLQKERLSLFLQLSKEVQARDNIVLNNYSEKKLKAKIREEDKKIASIEAKISENLKNSQKEKDRYAPMIQTDENRERRINQGEIIDDEKHENKFMSLFKGFVANETSVSVENVELYGNDFTKLFDAGEEKSSQGYDSYAFEKACVDAKINGLITGKITVYGSFLSVSLTLYQYPGARVIGYATDVGSSDDLKALASSLAMQITPRVADSMPVELQLTVFPEEANKNLIVTIDDVVYKDSKNGKNITFQSGIHTILFSSEGYDTVSASYNFAGSRKFDVNVNMRESHEGQLNFRLLKPYSGDIFGNAIFAGSVSPENPYASIKINNSPVLGHFISEDGFSTDFYIPVKYLKDGQVLQANARVFDRSKYIDKRRRWMYGSYSALIVSLMPTMYIYGTSTGKAVAYNANYGVDRSDAEMWQNASYVSMGVSAVCGVFFVYELIRYLKAASSVLPVNAKTVSEKELKRLEAERVEAQKENIVIENE